MRSKKVAFITGANRGIGLETARELGQKTSLLSWALAITPKGKLRLKG